MTGWCNKRNPNLAKGQLFSEWIYEVIVSPKIQTKIFQDFCLHYTGQKSWQFLIAILHHDLRIDSIFSLQFTLTYPIWTFISLFYLDFYFSLGLLFLFRTFTFFLDFDSFFGLSSLFSPKSRSDLGFLPSFCSHFGRNDDFINSFWN